MKKYLTLLIIGDLLTLVIVTIVGFLTHGPLTLELLPRMMTTFLPLLAGWFLLAPLLRLFSPKITVQPLQLWRPLYATFLAAPLTGVLRAAMLNGIILPLFVLILGASAALGMLLWRALFLLLQRRLSLVQ
ncbi:MAG: DUF3054 family protein [Anaerolineales bacterium]|jgi:hypothetical protein|nr:DUF3054 family protein [Anaerolineales bacterium]